MNSPVETLESVNMIEQPDDLKVSLFPHQKAMVYRMEALERDKFITYDNCKIQTDIGICADTTGYGKTMSVITLILRDKMPWDLKTDHVCEGVCSFSDQHVKQFKSFYFAKKNATLVLVGSSVIHQWGLELLKTPLKFIIITNAKALTGVNLDKFDVILVNPAMFNKIWELYPQIAWKRFVYDEPASIRVPAMKTTIAGFTWFITATPGNISHRHRSCRQSYMSRITDGFEYIRQHITLKNSDEFVQQSFSMPPTHQIKYECYVPVSRAIRGLVSDRISKFIEAGNILGAIQALGGQKTSNIVDLVKRIKLAELEDAQSKIRRWTLLEEHARIEEWKNRETEILRQIKELGSRFEKSLDDRCSICFDALCKPVMEPLCQNIFCGACLFSWLNTKGTCPLCRREVKQEELIYIERDGEKEEKEEKKEEEKKLPTKAETIIKIINDKKAGRFIIFSEYDASFDTIRSVLRGNTIPFVEIKGSVESRTKNIEKYRRGDVDVVFLNSNMDSSGINLQETTDIIIYHNMDEGVKKQILGRANRIGRTEPLYVHNL